MLVNVPVHSSELQLISKSLYRKQVVRVMQSPQSHHKAPFTLESFFQKSLSKVFFEKKTYSCERSTFESSSLPKVTFSKYISQSAVKGSNNASSSLRGLSGAGCCHSYERAPGLMILRSTLGGCQTNVERC